MTPLAVVFDIGKVLLDFDYRIAARRHADHSPLTPEAIHDLLNSQSALLAEYETGLLSTEDFFARFRELTRYRAGMAEFRAAFADIFTPIAPVVALHAAVRERGIPTYIFSNTIEIAIGHIRMMYPFYREFTDYVLSYEQGAMKPEPRIYAAVERFAGVPPGRIFYMDDREENIAQARTRGWQAVHHTDIAATLAAAREAGLME
jgi:glucose-1-phosphatase